MKKLFRSSSDSTLTGLCGGIAQYMNADPTVIRVLTVIAALFSFGSVVFIYIIASLIVPKEPYNNIPYSNHYHY